MKENSKAVFKMSFNNMKFLQNGTFCMHQGLRHTHITSKKTPEPKLPNPKEITSNMVGPPDPVSNLRRIIFKESTNETDLEKKFREMRVEVQNWNQKFWTEHNSRFFNERETHLKNNLPEGKQNLTADEMSIFYKAFLDKNWKSHINYNIKWYKKNITLLGLAIQVKLYRMLKK